MATDIPLKCIYPALPSVERGKFIKLGADPKKKNFLYCNGKNVFIRDIQKPDVCDLFTDHGYPPTVAKYNSTGNYIASGDSSGTVKVWDTTQPEHKVKMEPKVLGGAIKDISWSPEPILGQSFLAVGGEGREFMARVINAEDGSNRGNISGQEKAVNAIAFRPKKPYHIVTASEDHKLAFFSDRPFKYDISMKLHSNFVNCVRYQPQGDVYISGGADGRVLIIDGHKWEEKYEEFKDDKVKPTAKAHGAGVYGVEFSDAGDEVVTVSADKTAKIWNVGDRTLLGVYCFGKELRDMQVGCLWQGDNILSVSLSGFINYIDRSKPTNGEGFHTPLKALKGHSKPISSMAVAHACNRLYTSSMFTIGSDSIILGWDLSSGLAEEIQGKGHTSAVNDMTVIGDTLISVGMDDTVRYTSISSNTYSASCKLPSQPNGVAAIQQQTLKTVISCGEHIVMLNEELQIVFQLEVKFGPSSIDISQDGRFIAVGGRADRNIHIFTVEGNHLAPHKRLPADDEVTDVKFSPDCCYLAASTGSKRRDVIVFSIAEDFEQKYREVKHTAKVFSISWNEDSKSFASGSLDGSVGIWGLEGGLNHCIQFIKGAHVKGEIKKVRWLRDNVVATCAADGNIKQFFTNLGSQQQKRQ